jgi:hypothetical protein
MSEADDPNLPVTVFRTGDPGLLAVAQSLLDAAEIDFFTAGQTSSGLYPGAVSRFGVPEIRVRAEDAADARELLKELA